MKTVLLTGGLGFIGSHICVNLCQNYNVIIVDNLSNSKKSVLEKIKKITNKEVTFYEKDLRDNSINEIFIDNQIDYIIHLAGLKSVNESVSNPMKYYDNNLCSTINLIRIMEKLQYEPKLIFSSSSTVYGQCDPPINENYEIGKGISNPYGTTKFMIEQILMDLAKNSKWKIISLRYFNPVGAHKSGLIGEDPNDIPNNLMPYVLKVATNNNTKNNLGKEYDHLKIFGGDYNTLDGTCIRDFIHVEDLADGHVKALEKIDNVEKYTFYNLGTGNGVSVKDLVETFMKANNVMVPYKIVKRRPGDLEKVYCSNELAKIELNWEPKYNKEDMCIDAWNFQIKNI